MNQSLSPRSKERVVEFFCYGESIKTIGEIWSRPAVEIEAVIREEMRKAKRLPPLTARRSDG